MKSLLSSIFKRKQPKTDPVADFFLHTSKEEKEKVLLEIAKNASEDQRELLREYERKIDLKISHAR